MSKAKETKEPIKILQDPKIKTEWKYLVASMIAVCLFTALAYIHPVLWMQFVVEACLWGLGLLSVGVVIALIWNKGTVDHNKAKVPIRIPQWWQGFTGVTYSILLWNLSGGVGYLVGLYLFSKAVLSINYSLVLEGKDREYTEYRNSPLHRILNILSSTLSNVDKKSYGKKNHHKKDYWDVNDDDK